MQNKTIISLLLLLIFAVPLSFFLPKYIPYLWHQLITQQPTLKILNSTYNSTLRLKYLNELTQFPVLGHFFQEEKVIELVTLQRFEEAVVEANKAIESPVNARSFYVWYHKALSQCMIDRLHECEESLRTASFLSTKETELYVENIYGILELYKKQGDQEWAKTQLSQEMTLNQQDYNNEEPHFLQEL